MKNKSNEVKEFSEIVDIISRCDTIRIAMFDDPYPYIVPVNFGEEKEKALTLLMNHYHPESVKFNPKFVHMTQCMKIVVNDMTAKCAMPKKDTLDYKVMQFQGEVRSHTCKGGSRHET